MEKWTYWHTWNNWRGSLREFAAKSYVSSINLYMAANKVVGNGTSVFTKP